MEFDPSDADESSAHTVDQHEPEARPTYAETVAFFGHLAYRVPPLRQILARHLLETQGEMLPHLLMEDVLQWLLDDVGMGRSEDGRLALWVLDEGYRTGSEPFRHLLVVSFIEAIPGFAGDPFDAGGRGKKLRSALGPTLGGVLTELENYRRGGATPLG